ncbi:MAG TPA: type II toxin-antitoxin system death-on-curing family toxin [Candidatus Eisenbacteria bacterium]|nr:type II toxin-antitoxin system death-on-curing family toxin [Candidatus Eisenbacteria bacterium]
MVQHSKNLPISKEVIYISLEDLLIIHTDQIERYGGSHGIRDLGLVESALFRPQSSFGGEDLYPDFFDKAAVLVHSLLLNHAFVDGNKRTAMTTLLSFLEFNNLHLKVSQEELINAAQFIENKEWDTKAIASWLKNHTESAK